MENKEVEKFDPSTLMDGVKNRIKATFVSLIPDAQWEQMCDAEMKKFFEPIPKKDWNGRIESYLPSEFETIVIELMKEKCREYVKGILADQKYSINNVWKSTPTNGMIEHKELSEHLDEMIKEKMPEMLQAMVSNVMSSAFYTLFNNMQNQVQNYR